jgi:stearoyl-CoA desaturase (delta-9 desaturase)
VSARHGLAWYELDLNWIGISTLRMLGLAWDIKTARIAQPVPHEQNERLIIAGVDVDEAVA